MTDRWNSINSTFNSTLYYWMYFAIFVYTYYKNIYFYLYCYNTYICHSLNRWLTIIVAIYTILVYIVTTPLYIYSCPVEHITICNNEQMYHGHNKLSLQPCMNAGYKYKCCMSSITNVSYPHRQFTWYVHISIKINCVCISVLMSACRHEHVEPTSKLEVHIYIYIYMYIRTCIKDIFMWTSLVIKHVF